MMRDPGLAGWLQLALTPGLGPSTIRSLLREYGLPQAVLGRKRSELGRYEKWLRENSPADGEPTAWEQHEYFDFF